MKTYNISNVPKEETSKGGRYNPSPEERKRLRDLAKRAGIRNVRYNSPRIQKTNSDVTKQK